MLNQLRGALTALALLVTCVLALASFDLGIPGQALLQSLRFHLAALLLLLALLLFVSRTPWRSLLFLAIAALSVGQGAMIIYGQQQARAPLEAASPQPLLRLVSFNMLFSNTANAQRITDFLLNSGAGVIIVMEADALYRHLAELQQVYGGRVGCDSEDACDLLLLSRTPLTSGQMFPIFGGTRRLIVASTQIGGRAVNLVAAHLTKPYFDSLAVDQAAQVANALSHLDGPLLLAGDFNAAAWSGNIDNLANRAGLVPPPFYPATWPVEAGPLGVPIDNMFTGGGLLISSIRAFDDAMGSNHRGLIAELSLAAP